MPVPLSLKLGCVPSKYDARTLLFGNYIRAAEAPPVPAIVDWARRVRDWRVYAGDRYGTAVPAALAHPSQTWAGAAGKPRLEITDEEILSAYSAMSGFDRRAGAHDEGCSILQGLRMWRLEGHWGNRPLGYLRVDPRDLVHVLYAHWLCGGLIVAATMPLNAEQQLRAAQPWTAHVLPWGAAYPGSWGMHAFYVPRADTTGFDGITHGFRQRMTRGWAALYWTEAWAVLSSDVLKALGEPPPGFDLERLQADLHGVAPAL